MTVKGSAGVQVATACGEQRVECEHASLRALLLRMRSSRDAQSLGLLLDEARQLLGAHFAREEAADGFFAFVVEECPRHTLVIDRLRTEHQQLLEELDTLIALARAPLNASWRWSAEVCAFVVALEEHESIEASLLNDALQDELGTAG